MIDHKLSIVCVAYKRYAEIHVLINSFLAQTDKRFFLHIYHDGFDQKMFDILSKYKSEYSDYIDFTFSETRYNDYGHSLREQGIKDANGDFILITNDDNYYLPKFVEMMFAAIDEHSADIALCDMIHGHNRPGGRNQPAHCFFETAPRRLSIDMGCFIARTKDAKSVGFRDKSHDGDATYFEDVAAGAKIVKVPRVLFVHN